MNYYNENEKRDDGGPVIGNPGAAFKKSSAFGKTPAFSKAAGSIMERLKNLSKKDIAFVAVGMGVLVMAPVAEYMMSKPTGADQLTPGFGQRGDGSGGGGSVYEPGINALSQGSPDGSGEVITPLSSRDPASLIIGSQSSQPPAPQVSFPPKTDYRDSMKDSARAAFGEATKAAGIPTVIPRMQSSLRGMGSFFSGGENSRTTGNLSGGKIIDDARNASGKAASRSMVGPVGAYGYKGVASSVPNSSSKGAFEKLRGQADKAAGNFNGDSSIRSLDKAAADSVDIGRGSGGMGGGAEGEKYRSPSGSSVRDSKNSSGESLEQSLAKKRAEKALEWEFYKKYEIPKKIIEAVLGGFTSALTDFVKDVTTSAFGMQPPPAAKCWVPLVCSNTSECNTIAVKQFQSETWWNNHTYTEICRLGGGPTVVKTIVGKESAVSQQTWCPCNGVTPGPTPAPGAGPSGPGGDNSGPSGPGGGNTNPSGPGGGNNGPSGPGAPAAGPSVKKTFSGYDEALKMMLTDIQAGVKATEPKVLLENSKKVAGGFTNLKLNLIANEVASAKQAELADYRNRIDDAQVKVFNVQRDYNEFKSKYDKVVEAANNGTLKFRSTDIGGYSGSAVITPEIKQFINDKHKTLISADKLVTEANKDMKLNGRAFEAYTSQAGYTAGRAGNLSKDYTDSVLKSANALQDELGNIKDPSAERNTIIKAFKTLSGIDHPTIQPVVAPPAAGAPVVVAMNTSGPVVYRDAAAAQEEALIYSAYLWRGLPADAPLKDGELNDSQAIKDEQAAWELASPVKKMTAEEIVSNDNLRDGSMLAPFLRSSMEIPGDVKISASYPSAALNRLETLTSLVKTVRDYLISLKIDIDNPTGGAQPQQPQPPASTPQPGPAAGDQALAARKTAILANARLTNSEYDAATAVNKRLGNGTNAQYAKADYKNMTASKTEINRLVGVLSAADVKPTKEKLDELELHLGNFNKSYRDFQTHAKAAGGSVAAMPQPQPQIIINNNVQGGHGGGGGSAVVNNNTVVNPPQQAQPAAPPKPVSAPKEFSLKMNGGTFMKLTTANNSGESAVYSGSYREGMKALYKYEVVCVRSGKVFVIKQMQATMALFTTQWTWGGPKPVPVASPPPECR